MHIADTIITIIGYVVFYQFGKDKGYREALERIADGTIRLSIWAKGKNIHNKILEVNPEDEK